MGQRHGSAIQLARNFKRRVRFQRELRTLAELARSIVRRHRRAAMWEWRTPMLILSGSACVVACCASVPLDELPDRKILIRIQLFLRKVVEREPTSTRDACAPGNDRHGAFPPLPHRRAPVSGEQLSAPSSQACGVLSGKRHTSLEIFERVELPILALPYKVICVSWRNPFTTKIQSHAVIRN